MGARKGYPGFRGFRTLPVAALLHKTEIYSAGRATRRGTRGTANPAATRPFHESFIPRSEFKIFPCDAAEVGRGVRAGIKATGVGQRGKARSLDLLPRSTVSFSFVLRAPQTGRREKGTTTAEERVEVLATREREAAGLRARLCKLASPVLETSQRRVSGVASETAETFAPRSITSRDSRPLDLDRDTGNLATYSLV